jgi:hypothetical protein
MLYNSLNKGNNKIAEQSNKGKVKAHYYINRKKSVINRKTVKTIINASHGVKQIESITLYKKSLLKISHGMYNLKISHGIKQFEGITWYKTV